MEGGSITPTIRFGSGAAPGVTFDGDWRQGDGFMEFHGTGIGSLTVFNTAHRVEAVLSSADGQPIVVCVKEDGPPLDREWVGDDCGEDSEHGAATHVCERRAYAIVERDAAEHHELTFEVDARALRVHEIRFS